MKIVNPILLFMIGTFIGLTPYIFGSNSFDDYRTFVFSNEILYVYIIGAISFVLGAISIKYFYIKPQVKNKVSLKKDLNIFLTILILFSIFMFVKIISIYGMLPIVAILSGNESIEFVNQTQKDIGGGIFGIFFLTVVSLIILFPYSIIKKNKSLFNKILFWIHLLLLMVYTTYSGKRQMMFIFFVYTFSYMLIYYKKQNNILMLKKIKKIGLVGFVFLVSLFIAVGLIRENIMGNDVSVFEPIIHYASLPYINLTNIIIHQDSNSYSYSLMAFYETMLSNLPTFIKSMFLNNPVTLNMPLIEPTSPSTVYGLVFWNFGYIGTILFLMMVGMISEYFYLKAVYSKNIIYITIYGLLVWPLLSIHTYNHFINFMFLLIPILMIIIGNFLYKKLPKKHKEIKCYTI